ncbi:MULTISPECIES: excinuclease ABC subunit UvrC [Acinetobacter]|uniref:excinuclease ABC subunit UvrC n=1 Tax=Acinetobacter TaxID=469 RepID=UPI0002CEF145|nr:MULTISPECIES: excinuclease ABC subunit UvrC [Acinetobacter]NWJ91444.1 excinuclease ABC subunit UvrC [Acinetobacter sp. Swhac1]NWK51515.1 excinuclease ABC subunit UvrC [Acinetobacter sp. SwsAc5]ENV68677.1 UvrABC system protein C [Acinetobacter towneri DSM 14962 = CIP 107472]MBT0886037.1 excinuclease ABC subunit UvrC [Acinetobacter towneri]MCA4778728.1 excinuclease ABC subunit UvrC [Acinetobacter towneri]
MNPNAGEHIEKILANMTQLPGVYRMLGKDGELLYVGKAKNLKNRVSSYFVKTIEHPKTQALVARIYDIETLVVRSETEALLLEQNLIKLHRPPYNIMLRDDKSYVYIFVSADQPYPRIASGRGKGKHQIGKFFGPYPSAYNARDTLVVLQKLFNVRQCENSYFAQRQRPCLQYQIKRCSAPCVGLISPEEYKEDVNNSIRFLQGDSKELNQQLIAKMEAAAEALEFEKAVFYRDRMALLRDVQAQQAIYKLKGEADIIAIAYQAGVTCVQIMHVRNGKMLGGKSYFPDMLGDDLGQMLADFIANFYFQVADEIPAELIVNVEVADCKELEQALQQHFDKKIQIKHKVRETRAEWQELAQMNVQHAIKGKLANHFELNERFHQLEQVVGRPIDRIECFDISHTMGEDTVASCVVFDSGGIRKRDYRQFSIQDIQAGDDYAAMRQALTRRYKKAMLPDLLLIDGGKGQLNMAMEVMQELGLDAFMIGVSKGEGRKPGLETLHFTDGSKIQLPEDHKALHLIQQVRDEAHRFAITKHRAKRDKKRGSSILEVIPGLGPKRRRDLLTHFGGIQGVLKASEKELTLVPGLGEVMARTIYKVLHE